MIKRSNRPNRYTVVSNQLIEDSNLDWRDLGLLIYLLSKPDNWEVMPQQLANFRGAGRDAIYKSLKNLVNAGYASRKPTPQGGWIWTIYDTPNPNNQDEADPNPENPDTEIPNPENPTLLNTETTTNTDQDNGQAFDDFWRTYPRKEDKKRARSAFARLSSKKQQQAITDSRKRYRHTERRFVPKPTTYIHGERWDDELPDDQPQSGSALANAK